MSRHFTDPAATAEFRLATLDDVDDLVVLMRAFLDESDAAWKHGSAAPERFRQWLTQVIGSGSYPHIIAVADNRIVGSVAYTLSQIYTDEPVAEIDRFYVLPAYRRGSIGRVLLSLALTSAEGDGAVAMRAFVNSGIPGGANVFKRFGFTPTPHSVLLGKEF